MECHIVGTAALPFFMRSKAENIDGVHGYMVGWKSWKGLQKLTKLNQTSIHTVGEQLKDVDAAKAKEVALFWYGMAESVQVMGSFDGWSQGEHLYAEYTGSYTKFTTTQMLRPGRYEIKFLVDGEWQLSPEFPTVGEGLTQNNLLIVE